MPLRCTSAAGLIQVRGAKRKKFASPTVDPYTHLRRKLRQTEAQKFQKIPLMSDDQREKKIDLPFLVTSLSM